MSLLSVGDALEFQGLSHSDFAIKYGHLKGAFGMFFWNRDHIFSPAKERSHSLRHYEAAGSRAFAFC